MKLKNLLPPKARLVLEAGLFWRRNRIGQKIGQKIFPKWMEKRRRKRLAKDEKEVMEALIALSGDEPKEEPEMKLKGKLTYSSIAVLAVSWLVERYGLPVAPAEIEAVVTGAAALIGVLGGIYGRYRATKAAAE